MTGERKPNYYTKWSEWSSGEHKRQEKEQSEDKAGIRLLLKMKRRTKLPDWLRARLAQLMVENAKARIGLLGWDGANADALSPYYTKTRVGIKVDKKAIYLLYQNNGLREFIPQGIQQYLDSHGGKIPFRHQTKLSGYEKHRTNTSARLTLGTRSQLNRQRKKDANREGFSYIYREAPWLPKEWTENKHVIIDAGTGPNRKKVGEPANVRVPIGYTYVPTSRKVFQVPYKERREMVTDPEKLRKAYAETEEHKQWAKKIKKAEATYKEQSQKYEGLLTRAKTDRTLSPAIRENMRKTAVDNLKKLNSWWNKLGDEEPDKFSEEADTSWRHMLKPAEHPAKMKKIILYQMKHTDHWFGHRRVKGLHFLDKAMLEAVREWYSKRGWLERRYVIKRDQYQSNSDINANRKEFSFPDPNEPFSRIPAIHSKEFAKEHNEDPVSHLSSRIVIDYRIPAIYIQM